MTSDISLLKSFVDGQGAGAGTYTAYATDLDANFAAIEGGFNALNAEFKAFGGQNASLIMDLVQTPTLQIGFIGASSFVPSFISANTTLRITGGEALSSVGRLVATSATNDLVGTGSSGTRWAALRSTGAITLETSASQGALDLYSVNWNGTSFDTGTITRLPGVGANNIIVDGEDLQAARVQENISQGTSAVLGAFTYDRIAHRINDIVRVMAGKTTSSQSTQAALKPMAISGSVGSPGLILTDGASVFDATTGFYRAAANEPAVSVQGVQAMRWAGGSSEPQSILRAGTALGTPPLAYNADLNTGFGWVSTDRHRAIAGGISCMEWFASGGVGEVAVPVAMSGTGANRFGNLPEAIKTGNYTVVAADRGTALIGNSTSALSFTLTAAATLGAGYVFIARNINTGLLTIDPNGAEVVNGVSTLVLRQGEAALLWCTGTEWRAMATANAFREVLSAARTYYVRSDGSDSNDGRANTAGGAFLTLQKAINTVAALDLSTFAVTIQIGLAGSYAGFTANAEWLGGPGSAVALLGDPANAGNFVITGTVLLQNGAVMAFSGVDFTPSSGDGLSVNSESIATITGACTFGATAAGGRQILITAGAQVTLSAVCTMDGGAANWILAVSGGRLSSNAITHVFSGTPNYTAATVMAQTGALVSVVNATPSGAATGKRYDSTLNAVIFTNGGGANFFPGDVAGTATTGLYA